MMYVSCKLGKSPIHSIGIFAAEDIKQGQLIYTVDPNIDLNTTLEQFSTFNDEEKARVRYFGYWSKLDQVWHVDFEDMRYINHSFAPNTTQDFSKTEAPLTALRDIRAGEELTQNYLEFEDVETLKGRGISVPESI